MKDRPDVLRRYGTRSAELVAHIHADRTRLIGYVADERWNNIDFVACNANQGMHVKDIVREQRGLPMILPNAEPYIGQTMMGVCFECLVEIDGVPARQSCIVTVQDGMQVRRQIGAASLDDVGFGDES
jgi:hypothetical protein